MYNLKISKIKKEVFFFQIATIFSILKALKFGVANHSYVWEDFGIHQSIGNKEFFSADLFSNEFLPIAGPFLQYIFQYIYEIPFSHLVGGFLAWILISYLILEIAYKYTNDYLASLICCGSMMLLLPAPFTFYILPITANGLYLSFRDWSTVMCLGSILLTLQNKRLYAIILLSVNVFNHPTNTVNVFIFIFLSDLILGLKNKKFDIKEYLSYSVFILALLIKVFLVQTIDFGFEPISFNSHWDKVMLNEPDDISTLYFVSDPIFRRNLIKKIIIIVLALLIIKASKKKALSKEIIFAQGIIILVPIFTLLLTFYEIFLYKHFPGFLNDFIMPLELRRSWGLIPIFCLPIITQKGLFYIKRIKIFNSILINQKIGILLIFMWIMIFGIKPWKSNIKTNLNGIKKLWEFNKKDPYYFYEINNENGYFFGNDKRVLLNKQYINIESYYDVCNFIKINTKKDVSFIHPPYIKTFRYLTNRQGFASEKNDGNFAGLNRKFATRYYKQIEMLSGVDYSDLNEPMAQGGENYRLLRNGFLSLKKEQVLDIMEVFPGYNYFLTEINHSLNFPILFKNENFIIYDISLKI